MRYFLCIMCSLLVFGCKKYTDPQPFTDSRINNPYCNVPSALNYNWGFPGIPDNSLCIYPSTFFSGTYFYRDTIYDATGNVMGQDSFQVTITAIDTTAVHITGFCGSNIIKAKANRYYKLVYDSTFAVGQHLCSNDDTLIGGGSKKDFLDTMTVKFNYQINNTSGVSFHAGTATKL